MGSVVISLVLAIAALSSVIGYGIVAARSLERSEALVAEAQFEFTLSRASASIERTLQLGIPLAELQQSMPILERTMDQLTGVLAADVFSADGVTLFSTDRGALGEPVPVPWQTAIDERRGTAWRTTGLDTVTIGRSINNDFNLTEGWAAITVDRRSLPAALTLAPTILRQSAPAILLVTLATGIITVLVIRLGISRRRLEDLAGHSNEPSAQIHAHAIRSVRTAHAALSKAHDEMKRLDAEV